MKKPMCIFKCLIVILSIILISCNSQTRKTEEPTKIENTLQSVSYFKDTVRYDPHALLEAFTKMNAAIDEIGYPDAGYQLWVIQADTSDVRFMVEGFWPDQATYDIIHKHKLYIDAANADSTLWDGLINVNYYRFLKVK
jgi:hypothetical protein